MAQRIAHILRSISIPVIKELPFFLIFLVLIGMRPLLNIFVPSTNPDPEYTALDLAGRFAIVVVFAYLFSLLIHLTGKRWVKILAYALVLVFFTVDLFLLRSFGMMLRPNVLMLIAETNGSESSEFMRLFVLSKSGLVNLAIIGAVFIAIILAEWAYHRDSLSKIRTTGSLSVGLIVGAFLLFGIFSCSCFIRLLQSNDIEQYFCQQDEDMVRPTDPISNLFQSFYGLRLMAREMKTAISTNRHLDHTISVEDADSLNVVLVIGESHSKWHSSIYGYGLCTNPLLEAERERGNLFVFNDAVAPFCITSPAMKNMLCCNSVSDGEHWQDTPYIPAVFKTAGYNVFFWDNQRKVSPNALYTFAINSFLYDDSISRLSYTATNDNSYSCDHPLIQSFVNSHPQFGKHNLIVLHLMGQHFATADRFPHVEQFEQFTAESITRTAPYLTREKKQLIADYDNATLYNDYVLKRIFDLFSQKSTVVVYLSDHGEETYDYRDSMARHYTEMDAPWLKYVHEVPFLIWCSDKFMASHPTTIEQITHSVDRPFTTDNLCHLLFHLGGLQTSYYKAERDIISDQFKPRRRIVEGKDDYVRVDFDSVMKASPRP